jgi:hypothetical protein
MITTDYTDFNLELSRKKAHKINYKRIARIKILYYIFGVVLLFSGLGSYAYGCCDIICAPCIEQPNMPFCTSCIPTGCSYCGSGCCCPPKHCTNGVCCPSGQTGCGGTICCSSGETCCDNHCCPSGSTCCGAYGCCDTSTCERACVGGQCKDCGGDPYKACRNGECYDTRTKKCCTDITPNYICDINYSCCQGNCCKDGCCESEIEDELWCLSRGCGCNPIVGGGCSDKKEKENSSTVYYASGTGSKCRKNLGKILCYKWRSCTGAGFHADEACILLNPDVPEGFCSAWLWPYCQDCEGTGIWEDEFTENSQRCE